MIQLTDSQSIKVSTGRFYVEAVVRPLDVTFDNVSKWDDIKSEICKKQMSGIFSGIASEIEGYDPFQFEQTFKSNGVDYYVEDGGVKFVMRIINLYKLEPIKL